MKAPQFVPKSPQQTAFIGGLSAPSHPHALVCSSGLPAWGSSNLHSGPQVRGAEPADHAQMWGTYKVQIGRDPEAFSYETIDG